TKGRQPAFEWVRGQAHLIKVGEPCEMLSGHRQPRYQRPGQTGHSGKGPRWRPEHELLALGASRKLDRADTSRHRFPQAPLTIDEPLPGADRPGGPPVRAE